MKIDWQSLLATSTAEIVRERRIPTYTGTGVLWSTNPQEVLELSALGVMAWEGHEGKPDDLFQPTGCTGARDAILADD